MGKKETPIAKNCIFIATCSSNDTFRIFDTYLRYSWDGPKDTVFVYNVFGRDVTVTIGPFALKEHEQEM